MFFCFLCGEFCCCGLITNVMGVFYVLVRGGSKFYGNRGVFLNLGKDGGSMSKI